MIGISVPTLARWADEGRIPFEVGADGERVFRRDDLEKVTVVPQNKSDDPEHNENHGEKIGAARF